MNLTEILNWRYATKSMTNEVVPEQKINSIINDTLLCPTSSGLQPFHIFLISNIELKKKMSPIAMNQSVIVQSSHLMVFAAWDSYTEERINHHFFYLNKQRGMPDSTTDDYRKMLLNYIKRKHLNNTFSMPPGNHTLVWPMPPLLRQMKKWMQHQWKASIHKHWMSCLS